MKDENTSREKRRRRRIRNQIFAYFTLIVIIGLLVASGYMGVKAVVNYVRNYNDKVNRVIGEAESGASDDFANGADDSEGQGVGSAEDNEGYIPADVDDRLGELIESLISEMSTEEMVAGMFMVSPESITGVGTAVQAGEGTKTAITENPVGGVVYSTKNFKSSEQFTQMLMNTREYSKFPIFTAVQAECGSNTGFGIDATKSVAELTDTDSVKQAYGSIAEKLSVYGVDMNLAPVAEIVSEEGNAALQGRTFGSDALVAAPLVNASVQAMQESGVSAVLQKFPGIAAGSKSLEELKNSEFVIYDTAIKGGVDCIMVSNTSASGLTGDDTPATMSSVVIQEILRGTLGFNGVVVTDYLNDSSITGKYDSAGAAVAAIQAGCDVILEPANYKEAYEGVLRAVADGTISEERIRESIYRIYRVKYKNAL